MDAISEPGQEPVTPEMNNSKKAELCRERRVYLNKGTGNPFSRTR